MRISRLGVMIGITTSASAFSFFPFFLAKGFFWCALEVEFGHSRREVTVVA